MKRQHSIGRVLVLALVLIQFGAPLHAQNTNNQEALGGHLGGVPTTAQRCRLQGDRGCGRSFPLRAPALKEMEACA